MSELIGILMLGMALGCLFVVVVEVAGNRYLAFREREKRRKAAERARMIAAGEMCGEGYRGCTGGPNCPWDHK